MSKNKKKRNRQSIASRAQVVKNEKTAIGEKLTYRASDLSRYAGQQFCLRITLGNMDLDSCFFVYLDKRFEDFSIGQLLETYFSIPTSERIDKMESWLAPWKSLDANLSQKYQLLRQMFARVRERGTVAYHINHGPSNVNLNDSVHSHLGTSVFDDGTHDDKILDVVLEFHVERVLLQATRQWESFGLIHEEPSQDSHCADDSSRGVHPDRRHILGFLSVLGSLGCCFPLDHRDDDDNTSSGYGGRSGGRSSGGRSGYRGGGFFGGGL